MTYSQANRCVFRCVTCNIFGNEPNEIYIQIEPNVYLEKGSRFRRARWDPTEEKRIQYASCCLLSKQIFVIDRKLLLLCVIQQINTFIDRAQRRTKTTVLFLGISKNSRCLCVSQHKVTNNLYYVRHAETECIGKQTRRGKFLFFFYLFIVWENVWKNTITFWWKISRAHNVTLFMYFKTFYRSINRRQDRALDGDANTWCICENIYIWKGFSCLSCSSNGENLECTWGLESGTYLRHADATFRDLFK